MLELSKNFEEIYDAYFKIFEFEKENRNLTTIDFNDAVEDLISICKLFTLVQHFPESIKDSNIKADVIFLKNGINGLSTYTSSKLRLNVLKARTVSSKIAFRGKILKLRHAKESVKPISMDIFKDNNALITEKSQDEDFIDEIGKKLNEMEYKERFHIQFKEIKKTNLISLIYWFGYYFPNELLSL